MKKKWTIKRKVLMGIGIFVALVLVAAAVVLVYAGAKGGIGPFDGIFVEKKVKRNLGEKKGEVVFYGASNFTLWEEMEEDLAPYHIINNGFGGSTDKRLVKYADKLVLLLEPAVVFFQTGSNDYLFLGGTEAEKVKKCMDYKKKMFESFHEELPDAVFVVMSGLLIPGRSDQLKFIQAINKDLEKYCAAKSYMYFIDANDMTYDGKNFMENLFVKDGIHLNRKGQKLWAKRILPILDELKMKGVIK